MLQVNPTELRRALEQTKNAALVARQFNLALHQVYHFARTRKISLGPSGRPRKYDYKPENLIRCIRRALLKKGGLLRLSTRRGIPYHVVTNMAKKLKAGEHGS